jgi:hypothetical protein
MPRITELNRDKITRRVVNAKNNASIEGSKGKNSFMYIIHKKHPKMSKNLSLDQIHYFKGNE